MEIAYKARNPSNAETKDTGIKNREIMFRSSQEVRNVLVKRSDFLKFSIHALSRVGCHSGKLVQLGSHRRYRGLNGSALINERTFSGTDESHRYYANIGHEEAMKHQE